MATPGKKVVNQQAIAAAQAANAAAASAAAAAQARAAAADAARKPVLKQTVAGIGGINKATQAAMAVINNPKSSQAQIDKALAEAKAASTATKAASEIGSGMRAPMETKAGRNVQAALIKGAKRVTKAAVTAAAKETAKRRVGVREEIESFLLEKAESKQQQNIFGLALSVKRGETPRSEVSKQVLEIVDGMSEAKIRKFAKTKHEGLPRKKEG
jgi:colicin import membrane protein